MAKHGKKYVEARKLVDANKTYTVEEAVSLLKQTSTTKFDGSVDIAIKTNANPKFNDQMIRTTTTLPHGNGKTKRVAVFTSPENVDELKKSWADIVGSSDLIDNIKAGKFDFDILVTSPDEMRNLAPIAKVLGPKGLMPSPKSGTVTPNIAQTVEEIKKGKMEFRLDKTGNIHALVGKVSFDEAKLVDNINHFNKAVIDNRPDWVKGKLIKKVVVSTTMGPGIAIEVAE